MKIGLVGESPHDTASIINLFSKVYENLQFVNLINNIRGSQLDQLQPTKRLLRLEYQVQKPDLVIFIRDLDGLSNDQSKIELRKNYYNEFKTVVDRKSIFMLNIYEIEALILCDLSAFNTHYECSCVNSVDPHTVENPKEYLKVLNKEYVEVDNAEIFSKINHYKLIENSSYYRKFIQRFEKLVN
ncbi:hypothetical protein ACXZ1K_15860 [Pedobacter sp. PWIIR3]